MNFGILWIVLCFVLVGIGIPVSKNATEIIPVWLFMLLTLGVGAAFMVPLAGFFDRPKLSEIRGRVLLGVIMQALLGAVLYTVFLLFGLTYASAVSVGVVSSITPAVTLILSFWILHERVTAKKIIAIVLAIAAVTQISISGEASGTTAPNTLGVMFTLLAVFSVSLFFIYAKKWSVDLSPTTMTAGICLAGSVICLPAGIYQALHFHWQNTSPSVWMEVVFYGVFVWALPFLFTYIGIPRVSASTVGMASAITPVATTITAIAFFGENMTIGNAIALILVIFSIAVAEYRTAPPSGIPLKS